MSEFIFKIVIVPNHQLSSSEKCDLKREVKEIIMSCDVYILQIDFFQATKSDEELHPEIEELILQVEAEWSSSYPRTTILRNNEFLRRFNKKNHHLPCSYVMMYRNESFLFARSPFDEVKGNCPLTFGTLPHDGYFHEYGTLENIDKVTFQHDTRNVVILRKDFEIRFTYDNIRNIFASHPANPSLLLIDLFNPPIIFRLEHIVVHGHSQYVRHRNLDMNGAIDPSILGRANVLCLPIYNYKNDLEKITANVRARCSSKPVYYSCIAPMKMQKPSASKILKAHRMDFASQYMMNAILQRNFVLLAQFTEKQQLQKVVELSKKNPQALESALADVLTALESGKILNYWQIIENRFHYNVAVRDMVDFKEYIVPSNCCMTRKITITPTRLLLWAPDLLFGNRVVRNFDPDFAIRVSFRDDNMQKLTSSSLNADKGFMETAVKYHMKKGICIDSRRYEFLAWSNSQLRDHGVWMYAKDTNGVTSADIRKWMGDFSHIHNVPKYMARMGQCFSQTVDTVFVPLEPQSVRTVPDIERGYDPENHQPYNFSDGIGRICTDLAKEVHDTLGRDKLCCAFQIRYGGYKGMLVVDPTLKDTKIEFRKSMQKFDCPNSTSLEIARTSAPISLQLNRPLIALLNDLGVRHRVFLRLQENMLKDLTDMLFEEEKAAKILKIKSQGMYDFEDLSNAGIHLTTEPFFRSILLAIHRSQIGLLKTKANIAIDPDYGRNMLGVLDETGILRYGEVFVQYSTDIIYGETTKDTKVLEGVVLVSKSPCHHPGDARKFFAVDVPELHHIVDCIVFPQNGSRPHPNEMAGADLDGDEYAVIWLPELIFQCENKQAAHFPMMKSVDKSEITLNDMINFLKDYIRKDQIGMISSAHLALADRFDITDSVCQEVAHKVSIAVDFAKTGHVVSLTRAEKPKEYPDFMENQTRPEYKSIKALGKMYRVCRDYETENREISSMCQTIKVDPHLLYPGWEEYKYDALRMRNKYYAILGSLLRNYGIEHEAEIISTAFTQLHCRYQERNDRMDVMKVVIACFKKLISDFMLEFSEEFTHYTDAEEFDEAVLKKASSWYMVTYSDPEPKYLSFPWIVGKYLAIVKIRQGHCDSQPFSPAIMKFDEKILECENHNLLPKYQETGIWQKYDCLCDPKIVKRALQVLMLWANEEQIINISEHQKGLMSVDTFVRVFLHVAKLCNYVTQEKEYTVDESKVYSSGKLCLEFLKFCSSLRFYNDNDILDILPFYLYKPTKLAKSAVVAYHKFALLGIFRNLYFDQKIYDDLIDMHPIAIDFKLFGGYPIRQSVLKKSEETLKKYSDVQYICLSDHCQTKKVLVSALGSEKSITTLKSILRESPEFLKELFKTGNMPQKDVPIVDIGRNGNSVQNPTLSGIIGKIRKCVQNPSLSNISGKNRKSSPDIIDISKKSSASKRQYVRKDRIVDVKSTATHKISSENGNNPVDFIPINKTAKDTNSNKNGIDSNTLLVDLTGEICDVIDISKKSSTSKRQYVRKDRTGDVNGTSIHQISSENANNTVDFIPLNETINDTNSNKNGMDSNTLLVDLTCAICDVIDTSKKSSTSKKQYVRKDRTGDVNGTSIHQISSENANNTVDFIPLNETINDTNSNKNGMDSNTLLVDLTGAICDVIDTSKKSSTSKKQYVRKDRTGDVNDTSIHKISFENANNTVDFIPLNETTNDPNSNKNGMDSNTFLVDLASSDESDIELCDNTFEIDLTEAFTDEKNVVLEDDIVVIEEINASSTENSTITQKNLSIAQKRRRKLKHTNEQECTKRARL